MPNPKGSNADTTSHHWTRIRDYEEPPEQLAVPELQTLFEVWQDQRAELELLNSFALFKEKLNREWAVETGLIERLYSFDRGITELLIEKGLHENVIPSSATRNPKEVIQIIRDQKEAIDGVFDFVKGNQPLTISYIKQLHSLISRHQDTTEAIDQFGRRFEVELEKGVFKNLANNPRRADNSIHEYCPPVHVESEMDNLVRLHEQHIRSDCSPEVEAAWLHHRFTAIHPFQDGNGRVARTIATIVFVKAGWFPLVIRDSERDRYIGALESADQGSLKPLVDFFADQQKRNFVNALTKARDVEQEQQVDRAIDATRRRLRERKSSLEEEKSIARNTANSLHRRTVKRLDKVAKQLDEQLGPPILPHAQFRVHDQSDENPNSHYYRIQIVDVAKQLGYYADTRTHRSWVRLSMRDGITGILLVAFHGLGQEFNGLLACSAIWFERVQSEEGGPESTNAVSLANEEFVINYKEPLNFAEERFDVWLDACIVKAISYFERGALE